MYKTSISISNEIGQLLDYYKSIYKGQTKALTTSLLRLDYLMNCNTAELLSRFSSNEMHFLVSILPTTIIEPPSFIPYYFSHFVSRSLSVPEGVKKKPLLEKLSKLTLIEHFQLLFEIEKLAISQE